MTSDITELRAALAAATPGPWFAADWNYDGGDVLTVIEAREPEKLAPGQSSIWPDGMRCVKVADTSDGSGPNKQQLLADAAYIAACSPDRIARLLDRLEAAERWRGLYRRAVNEANGLTNYVDERPELRRAEQKLDAIQAEARAIDAAMTPTKAG